jgi:hypothetical protein
MFFLNHVLTLKYQPSWIMVKGMGKTKGVRTSSPMINILTVYRQQILSMFSHICNFISHFCLELHHLNYLTMTSGMSSNSSSQLPQATSSSICSSGVLILNLHIILNMLPFVLCFVYLFTLLVPQCVRKVC